MANSVIKDSVFPITRVMKTVFMRTAKMISANAVRPGRKNKYCLRAYCLTSIRLARDVRPNVSARLGATTWCVFTTRRDNLRDVRPNVSARFGATTWGRPYSSLFVPRGLLALRRVTTRRHGSPAHLLPNGNTARMFIRHTENTYYFGIEYKYVVRTG